MYVIKSFGCDLTQEGGSSNDDDDANYYDKSFLPKKWFLCQEKKTCAWENEMKIMMTRKQLLCSGHAEEPLKNDFWKVS